MILKTSKIPSNESLVFQRQLDLLRAKKQSLPPVTPDSVQLSQPRHSVKFGTGSNTNNKQSRMLPGILGVSSFGLCLAAIVFPPLLLAGLAAGGLALYLAIKESNQPKSPTTKTPEDPAKKDWEKRWNKVSKAKQDYSSLKLEKKNINGSTFDDCNFDRAIMQDATINDSQFLNSSFTKAVLDKADIKDSTFHNSKLYNPSLVKAYFSNVKFNSCNLQEIDGLSSSWKHCNFKDSDLSWAKFDHASIENTQFENCTLTGLRLDSAHLENCSFRNATLDLVKLNSETQLNNIDFSGADLSQVENLDKAIWTNCIANENTRFPPDIRVIREAIVGTESYKIIDIQSQHD